jgi:hypothetical protein
MNRPRPYYRGSETRIADVIIATGLNFADEEVQIQALEVGYLSTLETRLTGQS